MPNIERPWYPIIYVRGYAGNDGEIEDTVAEPYMGFNLGSTKFRQFWDGRVQRHYFESPLVRLGKDYEYSDVYSGGEEMPLDCQIGPRSVFIYRYYDEQYFDALYERDEKLRKKLKEVSGQGRKIEDFAEGLSRLILRIRDRICGDDAVAAKAFRVYLVGHSMGGLVCRCFLQNPGVGDKEAKDCVDKVFTYASPHNGIDFKVLGNVPGFFTLNDINNFNRGRIGEYLALKKTSEASNLEGRFDVNRFFCLVGTNWQDYGAAAGISSRLTGPMSDGLVRIINATVHSKVDRKSVQQGPRAFVNRSHSGHYGIVNSEEGYQNLVRFLFGNFRVDGVLKLEEISLPKEVSDALEAKKRIRASYHFEVIVRVRGYDWELHRRTVRDESAIFRTFDEMFPKDGGQRRQPHLFSTFLSSEEKVDKQGKTLGFAIDLSVQVPRYEIEGRWWRDQYYAGSYLYRDTLTFEIGEGDDERPFTVRYGFDSATPNRTTKQAPVEKKGNQYIVTVPIKSSSVPGLTGVLEIEVKQWS